jgi:hypothetical protein
MNVTSTGAPPRVAGVRLLVGDSPRADRHVQADDRFELARTRATHEAPARRITATALRSAPELEHDASVVSRLGEELGHALSALAANATAAKGAPVSPGHAAVANHEAVDDSGRLLAELGVGDLSVRMQLVSNALGETLMRASFQQPGADQTTEDTWLGISSASQDVPSRFAAAFRTAAARLSPREQTALAGQLRSARQEITAMHSALLHQLSARELRDSAEHQRLTLLIAGPRA